MAVSAVPTTAAILALCSQPRLSCADGARMSLAGAAVDAGTQACEIVLRPWFLCCEPQLVLDRFRLRMVAEQMRLVVQGREAMVPCHLLFLEAFAFLLKSSARSIQ